MALVEAQHGLGFGNGEVIKKPYTEETRLLDDRLWRGRPLSVSEDMVLPAHDKRTVPFIIASDCFPSGASDAMRDLLRVHVRSRYAHLGIDIEPESVLTFLDKAVHHVNNGDSADAQAVSLDVANHSARSIRLGSGSEVFHLFAVPDKAQIKGIELEHVLGQEIILGEEDIDWARCYIDSEGRTQEELQGVYIRIAEEREQRHWIPASHEPLELPAGLLDFASARAHLFSNHFRNGSEHPIPEEHLWIGRLTPQAINTGIYGVLSRDVYDDSVWGFVKAHGAFQTSSPLLEGRVNNHGERHHVEIVGDAKWVQITYVRGEVVAG